MAMPINTPSRQMIVRVRTSEPSGSPRISASESATLMAPKADHTIVANNQRNSTAAAVVEIGSPSHVLPNRRNNATVIQAKARRANLRHGFLLDPKLIGRTH